MKKLSLKPIKIQSFITSLNNEDKKNVKGGTDPIACLSIETCPEATCETCPPCGGSPITCNTCNTCNTCYTCYTCYSCENTCDPCISEGSLCPYCG